MPKHYSPPIRQVMLKLDSPSLNKVLRMHWATRRALKKNWGTVLKSFLKQPPALPCTAVTIHSFRIKLLDYDNLVGGAKEVIVDNLKDLGFIEDDSPDKVQISYEQSKTKRGLEGTLIAMW